MQRKEILDVVLILLILALLGTIGYSLVYINKYQIQCLQNPVLYYEQMKNVSCSCGHVNPYKVDRVNIGGEAIITDDDVQIPTVHGLISLRGRLDNVR